MNKTICSTCSGELIQTEGGWKHSRPLKHLPVPIEVRVEIVWIMPDYLDSLTLEQVMWLTELQATGTYEFYVCSHRTSNAAGRKLERRKLRDKGVSFQVNVVATPPEANYYLTHNILPQGETV